MIGYYSGGKARVPVIFKVERGLKRLFSLSITWHKNWYASITNYILDQFYLNIV